MPHQAQIDGWQKNKLYDKGAIVTHKGFQYEAQDSVCIDEPGEREVWRVMDTQSVKTFTHNGKTCRVKYNAASKKFYFEGNPQMKVWKIITPNEEERAILDKKAIEGDVSPAKDKPVVPNKKEKNRYEEDDIVNYEGNQYQSQSYSMGDKLNWNKTNL
ncbi:hypothetical protein CN553_28595 [Bacillus cereus]|uniref:Uncharacterized protein n=1 Tax=Bacillus cereus TaxID=1396 RepID=A0A9X6U6D8_BACCE|nr:hypothetical protein [Bacillus cereus]PEN82604.1 hypothetical protein CN553_28595 [Bacillus cereus]